MTGALKQLWNPKTKSNDKVQSATCLPRSKESEGLSSKKLQIDESKSKTTSIQETPNPRCNHHCNQCSNPVVAQSHHGSRAQEAEDRWRMAEKQAESLNVAMILKHLFNPASRHECLKISHQFLKLKLCYLPNANWKNPSPKTWPWMSSSMGWASEEGFKFGQISTRSSPERMLDSTLNPTEETPPTNNNNNNKQTNKRDKGKKKERLQDPLNPFFFSIMCNCIKLRLQISNCIFLICLNKLIYLNGLWLTTFLNILKGCKSPQIWKIPSPPQNTTWKVGKDSCRIQAAWTAVLFTLKDALWKQLQSQMALNHSPRVLWISKPSLKKLSWNQFWTCWRKSHLPAWNCPRILLKDLHWKVSKLKLQASTLNYSPRIFFKKKKESSNEV